MAVNRGSVIEKIDPQGNVTVLAGSGTTGFKDGKGPAAQFLNVVEVQVDNAGNVWVADAENHAVRKITPDGTVTTIAGNGTPGYKNGNAANARFNYPAALAIDKDGVVYTLEGYNNVVRKIKYYN
ncbi:hypothetical protein A4H97_33140 [Niastella yeongjuensis]|uniref:SMP-30/Gluconolactonase/LRE-like region domain-containing protein n=1 Tax=Niastella yeongjuensis TaxID=354355 RepID=A0A1V9EFU9_9BACT|nr:hypothetical protein [Niastella yeongjuensis]OQP45010.1 hypothetical protein A4H97_33140 [Niastella yeongjuensis]SEP49083.1 NHL repeat-containing protein [Niastella yeongjuensis]